MAVAPCPAIVKYGYLSPPALGRPIDKGQAKSFTGGIQRIAGRKIVGSVGHHYKAPETVHRVACLQTPVEDGKPTIGSQRTDFFGSNLGLQCTQMPWLIEQLAIQVAFRHHIEIYNSQVTHPSRRQIQQQSGTESPAPATKTDDRAKSFWWWVVKPG